MTPLRRLLSLIRCHITPFEPYASDISLLMTFHCAAYDADDAIDDSRCRFHFMTLMPTPPR
jgi:hypothetical protein